jgi:hypothetical protein
MSVFWQCIVCTLNHVDRTNIGDDTAPPRFGVVGSSGLRHVAEHWGGTYLPQSIQIQLENRSIVPYQSILYVLIMHIVAKLMVFILLEGNLLKPGNLYHGPTDNP